MPKVTFNNKNKVFYNALKVNVDQYFQTNNIRQTGNWKLYSKTLLLVPGAIALYILLLTVQMPAALAITLCVAEGFILASIGFNVMHDGAHGSFSKYQWVNHFAAFSLNILGGNSFMWNMKHNIIHHAFTNVDGVDDDIDIQPWMRMSATQKKYKLHKYQHFYFWFLYSLLYIFWIFLLDYQKYFKSKVGSMELKKMKLL